MSLSTVMPVEPGAEAGSLRPARLARVAPGAIRSTDQRDCAKSFVPHFSNGMRPHTHFYLVFINDRQPVLLKLYCYNCNNIKEHSIILFVQLLLFNNRSRHLGLGLVVEIHSESRRRKLEAVRRVAEVLRQNLPLGLVHGVTDAGLGNVLEVSHAKGR